ncbi:MAG TPA: hypothetical protein VKZ77_03315 [Bacillaceae bacterium]|nr:hypothetical protein [Paenibacillus bovis]HLU21495.1 hypothetical protein [Bacillaceae bacterium]
MITNKKRTLFFFISTLVIFSIFTVYYHVPVKIQKSFLASTLDEKQVDVKMDVKWKKYFFSPTELRGTITVDDITYHSFLDTDTPLERDHFWERLDQKFKNEKYIPLFIIPHSHPFDIHNNFLDVLSIDDNFNIMSFAIAQKDISQESNIYFGPAKNSEEAQRLWNEIK